MAQSEHQGHKKHDDRRWVDESDEVEADEEEIILYGEFSENNNIQHHLEEAGYEIVSAEFERIPNDVKDVTPEQRASIEKLIERFEEDEDVQNVFHNMKEEEDEE